MYKIIVLLLVTDRSRSGVPGIDGSIVRQYIKFRADGFSEVIRISGRKICPAHRLLKQRIAAKKDGVAAALLRRDEIAAAALGVSGRQDHLQRPPSQPPRRSGNDLP